MILDETVLENQISIMLKGVSQHTEISEIKEKLLDAYSNKRPLRVKLGLDPSAPDIHVGHAVVLRKMRQLQDLGHVAVLIIGDFTGMIGDPTGKSKTRRQLTVSQTKENAQTYLNQVFKILDKDRTEVHFNSEWLSKMTFSDVIDLASKCTVARMLERADFNNRYLNHLPLSVHEFFYPLMQAYDSVAIRADIELGGTDQTFNILLGRNIQRDYGLKPQLTLFMPLLEGIDGSEKMSKSLGNYIGIDEPAHIMYEKVMKIPDALIIKYYNLCTDVSPNHIMAIEEDLSKGVNPRDIKMGLAREITSLYHGGDATQLAEKRFVDVFQKNQTPDDLEELFIYGFPADYNALAESLVSIGALKSKSELRRIIQQGGFKINDITISRLDDVGLENGDIVKIGKKMLYKVTAK